MTTGQQVAPAAAPARAGVAGLIGPLCFTVLGGLTGRSIDTEVPYVAAGAAAGLAFQGIGLTFMAWVLWAFNPGVRRHYGYGAVWAAVSRGFLLLVPFTTLAFLAEVGLEWNAVQAFTSAGMMASGAAAGAELGRLGGGRLRSMLIPAAWAFGLAAVWMVAAAFALQLWKTLP